MTCSGHPTPSRNLLRKHRGDKDGQRPSGNYPEAKRWVDVCFEGLLVRLFIFLLQFKRVNLKLCTSENCLRPELLHSAPPGTDQCSKAVSILQAQFWLTPEPPFSLHSSQAQGVALPCHSSPSRPKPTMCSEPGTPPAMAGIRGALSTSSVSLVA